MNRLSTDEWMSINRLTFKNTSGMREDVLRQSQKRGEFQIFLARHNGTIIGWAVAYPAKRSVRYFYCGNSKLLNIFCYVRRANRRNGVGKTLVSRAAVWVRKSGYYPRVFTWDQKSFDFYWNVNSSSSKLRIVDHM
jgi:GNAT superfamily N-acetyltransferase